MDLLPDVTVELTATNYAPPAPAMDVSAAFPATRAVLVRRAVIEEVNGWEESFRTLYEDMVLWTKIFTRWPVFVSDGCWDLYRQHAGNSVVGAAQEGVWDPQELHASLASALELKDSDPSVSPLATLRQRHD